MTTRTISKALGGVEDLLFGQGAVSQIRGGVPTAVQKINASHIPFSGDNATADMIPLTTELLSRAKVVGSVADMLRINPLAQSTVIQTESYHTGLGQGSGFYVYESNRARTEHNGGTIIASDKTFPVSWPDSAWFVADVGTGNGCWVLKDTKITVDHFGTLRDGSTPDHLALTAAIAEVSDLTAPAGTYLLGASIPLVSNRVFKGENRYATIFIRDSTLAAFDMFEGQGVTNVTLSDFTVDGAVLLDVAIAANRFCGIRVHGTANTNIHVTRIHVTRTTSGEHQVEGSRGAILFENVKHGSITDCSAIYNRATCIFTLGETQYLKISDNILYGENGTGSSVGTVGSGISGDHDGYVEFSNNIIVNGGYSNLSCNGPYATITGNVCIGSAYSGINIGHGGASADPAGTTSVTCTGNLCRDNTLDGISTAGMSDILISGNTVEGSGRDGISTLKTVGSTLPQDNIQISNNIVSNSTGQGIMLSYGDFTLVASNTVHHNGGGIYVEFSGVDVTYDTLQDIRIADNFIYDNGGLGASGIVLETCTLTREVAIEDNRLSSSDPASTQSYGITVASALVTATVKDNVIKNTTTPYRSLSSGIFKSEVIRQDSKVSVTGILSNGWTSSNAGYLVDSFGWVHLYGVLSTGTVANAAFTLPTELRPTESQLFSTVANNLFAKLNVLSSGEVIPYDSNVNFQLYGITFKAGGL